ncbi:hypothetical protein F183_A24450 [Bryobacterales bacterium F-183]|nr:hypothetical protein F183_A24450 [Bryobacterales bacterium F-183]
MILERGRQCEVLKHKAFDPCQMLLRPPGHALRRLMAVPQQKLAKPLSGAMLVLAYSFALPDQIAQRFVLRIRHPDWRQVTGTIASRELGRITAVGLHAIPRLCWDQRWRDHLAGYAELG